MGIFSRNKASDLETAVRTVLKEYDYSKQENRGSYSGAFALNPITFNWTDVKSYSERIDAIMTNGIAKTCVLMRAKAISNIDILVKSGVSGVKEMLESPNVRDGTIQTFLHNSEFALSCGGGLPLFVDGRISGRPMIHAFRQDLVQNFPDRQCYEYNPSGNNPLYRFEYDKNGKTTRAVERSGNDWRVIKGGLFMANYFDPRTSGVGAGAGDTALKAIDVINAIDAMLARKAKSGGAKHGYFETVPGVTDADLERLKANMTGFGPDSGTQVFSGVKFNDAQLTFAEMQILEARNQMAREICTAFQVPAELVNESESTYANARGKDKIFYRNFIGPEAHWLVGQLQTAIRLYLDPNCELSVDETSVQHLEEDRLERASKMAQMKCFTADEIRAVQGYKPAPKDAEFVGASVNMGQPEEKPKGEVGFNADAGNRGDKNGK